MLSNFKINASLMSVDETLQSHSPYMIIALSSTGIDKASEFSDHRPTRVYVQEYIYNQTKKDYEEGIHFDKMVECTPDALNAALSMPDGIDVFYKAGINKEEYQAGKNVLSTEDFKKEFESFISAHADGTKFIINNSYFTMSMLKKINCIDELERQARQYRVLDLYEITKGYFDENKIDFKPTFENINHILNNDTNEVVGIDNRAKIINNFIIRRGREQNFLLSEQEVENVAIQNSYFDDISKAGKAKYKNGSVEEKLQTLSKLKNSTLTPDLFKRDYDCNLNRLFDIFEGKNGIKGFVIMQVATTGFTADDEPIQVSALQCSMSNGAIQAEKYISLDIQCSDRAEQLALSETENGKFNAFDFTGINYKAYKSGKATLPNGEIDPKKPVYPTDQAALKLDKFFSEFKIEEYPLITSGNGGGDTARSYSQSVLKSICNIPIIDAPYIDFSALIKEYTFVAYYQDKYKSNALFNEEDFAGRNFSLGDFSNYYNKPINHTLLKCDLMGEMLTKLNEQHLELEKPLYAINQTERVVSVPKTTEQIQQDAEKLSHKERPVTAFTQSKAKEFGAQALYNWRVSQRENRCCASYIAEQITNHQRGNIYDNEAIIKSVFNEYPKERISYVLAVQIYENEDALNTSAYWDSRIDKNVQMWARNVLTSLPYDFDFSVFSFCKIKSVNNPSVINALINKYIELEPTLIEDAVEQATVEHKENSITNKEAFINEGYNNVAASINFPSPEAISESDEEYKVAESQTIASSISGEYKTRPLSIDSPISSSPTQNSKLDELRNRTRQERLSASREGYRSRTEYSNSLASNDLNDRTTRQMPERSERFSADRNTPSSAFSSSKPTNRMHRDTVQEQTSSLLPSVELQALINAINAQSSAIRDQNALMREQNNILKEQNNNLFAFINTQTQVLSVTIDLMSDKIADKEAEQALSIADRLEKIKDKINELYNQITNKPAKGYLQSANDYLSKGQNSLEKNIVEFDENNPERHNPI